MTPLEMKRQSILLIIQHLNDENYKETLHQLEKESGFFFNMEYFEELVTQGELDEAEKYLSGFTTIDENLHSKKIFFEIRKQRFLEALDRNDKEKAKDILENELKLLIGHDEKLFEEMLMLLNLKDFREVEKLSSYVDANSARANLAVSLKAFIHENTFFQDKLLFPNTSRKRLWELLNQSMYWQHQRYMMSDCPLSSIELETLFEDHTCKQTHGSLEPIPANNRGGFMSSRMDDQSAHSPGPATSIRSPIVSSAPMIELPLVPAPASITTPPVQSPSVRNAVAASSGIQQRSTKSPSSAAGVEQGIFEDFPKTVVAYLSEGSLVSSMAFHPLLQAFLLVGTYSGDISIWDVASKRRLVHRYFKIWELSSSPETSQLASLANESASVNCVSWSHQGTLFGVGYSKRILHVYSYVGEAESHNHLQIDAHAGSVSDLTFARTNTNLCVVTCGDDKTVKMWDTVTGSKLFTFEGHNAPVCSVCTHHVYDQGIVIEFILSASADGDVHHWRNGESVDGGDGFIAQGLSIKRVCYSTDEQRLFSFSTDRKGEPCLAAFKDLGTGMNMWEYQGLGTSAGVQFDTTRNKYLAAGDESVIKFWHFNHPAFPVTIDFVGGLPASPRIKFNKHGTLLAVSTIDNSVKVLANAGGTRLVRFSETLSLRL